MALHLAPVAPPHEIAGPRLLLRPPRRADLADVHEAICESLPELVRWLPWARPGHDRFDTRRQLRAARLAWARGSAFEFAVTARGDARILGMASLHRIDRTRRCAGLGYWIRSSATGRGHATEAAQLVTGHAFGVLGLHRIELHIAPGNAASHAVAAHLGAQREGLARDAEILEGRFLDHVQYSLLSTDEAPEPLC